MTFSVQLVPRDAGAAKAPTHRCRVLYLHLPKQDVSILGQLDCSSAINKHLDRAGGSQVGFEDILQTLTS